MILINMEMPKSCLGCPICCGLPYQHRDTKGRRPDCPLIEVPKHGRLIDADAISEDDRQVYGFYNSYDLQQLLDSCPTIIEAEGNDGL